LKKGYGLVQLPCPEALLLGFKREPATKAEYEELGLRPRSRELVKEISVLINSMLNSGIKIVAFIGVAGSPSCGVYTTHIKSKVLRETGRGIFTEELLEVLPKETKLLEWDFKNPLMSLLNVIKTL